MKNAFINGMKTVLAAPLAVLLLSASGSAWAQSAPAAKPAAPAPKAAEAAKTTKASGEAPASGLQQNFRKDKKIVLRISHVNNTAHVKHLSAMKFKEILEAKFPGRIVVEVYPDNKLYRDREEIEALQLGIVEMIIPAMGKLATIGAREFEVFDLPFLFPNEEKLHEVLDGEIGKALGKGLEKRNLKLLGYWDNGFKSFSSKTPITSPADFKGQRLRIQSNSAILRAQMEAIGGKPVPMAFADVAKGFKDGIIDGTENPMPNLLFMDMYKEQKHLLLTEHGYLGYVVLMNTTFWNRLPEEMRVGISDVMKDVVAYERGLSKSDDAKALDIVTKHGLKVVKPNAQQLTEFRNAMIPVHELYMKTPNKDLLISIYKVVNPGLMKAMEEKMAANKAAEEKKAKEAAAKADAAKAAAPKAEAPKADAAKAAPAQAAAPKAEAPKTDAAKAAPAPAAPKAEAPKADAKK